MKRKSFTLVELIIVIAIIATLSVIAVMTITEWIGKSRDTRRLADLGQIEKALDIAYTKNGELPMPDSYVNVMASGTSVGYQGKFCDTAVAKTSIKVTTKDPMDDTCYSYFLNADKNKFQIMGMLENDKKIAYESSRVIASNSLDQSKGEAILEEKIASSETNLRNNSQGLLNSTFAADYTKRYPKVRGEKLGILVVSGTNQPIEDAGSSIDIVNTTSNYIAYINDATKVTGTGGKISCVKNLSKNGYDPTLVGYWDMETNGTGLMMDLAGTYGNIGTLAGTITPSTIDGKSGKSTLFDGSSSRINMPDSTAYDFTNKGFTVSLWIYHTEAIGSADAYISYGGSYAGNLGWYIRRKSDGKLEIYFSSNGTSWDTPFASNETISSNSWHNVVVVRDGNTINAYLDGTKLTFSTNSYTNSISTVGNKLLIGSEENSAGGYTNYFGGYIDEVRLYNRTLSDSEIQSLYTSLK